MLKTLVPLAFCLCLVLFVQGQAPPAQPKSPDGGDAGQQQPPPKSRVARQMGGQPGGFPSGQTSGGGGNPGNLGMQGLGNIPDPTAWIQKGQEIASQFARGRRDAADEQPPPPPKN